MNSTSGPLTWDAFNGLAEQLQHIVPGGTIARAPHNEQRGDTWPWLLHWNNTPLKNSSYDSILKE